MANDKITVLGSNGHIGHAAVKAFAAAGWEVTAFGRSNRRPVAGVRFVSGDAGSVEEMRAAIGDSAVVLNALNLPYAEWDKGRMEALYARVIEAMGTDGKTMLFPVSIYNYAPTNEVLTPDLPQNPPTPRGAIRMRVEQMLSAAAQRGDIQVLLLRAGDYYGEDSSGDWFDYVILREAAKRRVALLGKPGTGHAWAYLPDLARAFVALAQRRGDLAEIESFHYAGHFVTPEEMAAAIGAAAPVPMRFSAFPWLMLSILGIVSPMYREIAKMGYLWQHPMALRDLRLDALLGPGFGTAFEVAIERVVQRYLAPMRRAA